MSVENDKMKAAIEYERKEMEWVNEIFRDEMERIRIYGCGDRRNIRMDVFRKVERRALLDGRKDKVRVFGELRTVEEITDVITDNIIKEIE